MKPEELDLIVTKARENLEEYGSLTPIFIVGNEDNSAIVGAIYRNEREKDLCAAEIRKLAKQMEATWVLYCAESWSVPPHRGLEYMIGLQEGKWLCVEQCPFRTEVVSFMLERWGERDLIGMAEVIRVEGKRTTFGEPRFIEADQSEGRFTHFLGPKAVS